MALLGSKTHTSGDTKRWTVNYDCWLANSATIEQIDIQSNSTTCTVGDISILGRDIIFFLTGGVVNEQVTLSLVMTDNLGNVKNDTVSFVVVAP
jgi:hypothetical protein